MKIKNDRITLYCELFDLKSRRTGGVKINKKFDMLAPYEKFFSYLSNQDIQNILAFINRDSNEVSFKIKREKKVDQIKSESKSDKILKTLTIIDGKTYKAYIPSDTKIELILKEYMTKIELEEKDKEKRSNEMYEYYKIEKDWENYCQESFETQNQYQCFDAFVEFLEGNETEALKIEAYHKQYQELLQNNIEIVYNPGEFLYYKNLIERSCEYCFDSNLHLIDILQNKHEIISNFIKMNPVSADETCKMFSENIIKLNPTLIKLIAKEKFSELITKYITLYY